MGSLARALGTPRGPWATLVGTAVLKGTLAVHGAEVLKPGDGLQRTQGGEPPPDGLLEYITLQEISPQ